VSKATYHGTVFSYLFGKVQGRKALPAVFLSQILDPINFKSPNTPSKPFRTYSSFELHLISELAATPVLNVEIKNGQR
jgi:hypothetical protein